MALGNNDPRGVFGQPATPLKNSVALTAGERMKTAACRAPASYQWAKIVGSWVASKAPAPFGTSGRLVMPLGLRREICAGQTCPKILTPLDAWRMNSPMAPACAYCRRRPGIEPLWRPELSQRRAEVVVEEGYSEFK